MPRYEEHTLPRIEAYEHLVATRRTLPEHADFGDVRSVVQQGFTGGEVWEEWRAALATVPC